MARGSGISTIGILGGEGVGGSEVREGGGLEGELDSVSDPIIKLILANNNARNMKDDVLVGVGLLLKDDVGSNQGDGEVVGDGVGGVDSSGLGSHIKLEGELASGDVSGSQLVGEGDGVLVGGSINVGLVDDNVGGIQDGEGDNEVSREELGVGVGAQGNIELEVSSDGDLLVLLDLSK